jgi:hypothetical protein
MKHLSIAAALLVSSSAFALDLCNDYTEIKCSTSYEVGNSVVINSPKIVVGPDEVSFNVEQTGQGICKLFGVGNGKISMQNSVGSAVVTAFVNDGGTLTDLKYSQYVVSQVVCVK